MSEAKPFKIPKRLVWEAYQRVRANRGAAGVDGVSLAAFEKDLKGNLYKVWNRMPDVKLAPHPAPTLQPPVARRAATGRTDWGPVARCFPANASMLVPGV